MKLGPVVFESIDEARAPRPHLTELLERYDVVDIPEDGSYMVVTERSQSYAMPSALVGKEIGAAGQSYRREYGFEEYNTALTGLNAVRTYDKMRRSDSTVRQSLRIAKTPVLSGRWFVESADPMDDEANAQAQFINDALFHWRDTSWFEFLTEALGMLDFGWSSFEKVFELRRVEYNGRMRQSAVWKKFAPRHPLDLHEFKFGTHGEFTGAEFMRFRSQTPIHIPAEKLLMFTFDKEAGNVEGISALRSAYKHWYYKDNLYKIDAIQKERHAIGIPVIKLPPNFSDTDRRNAQELGRNLRTNERAHVVLPPFWEIEFADIKGSIVDIAPSIEHHDNAIVRNVLANFVGTETSAAATVQVELFLKATRFIADIVADVLNEDAIPELIDYNFSGVTQYPKLGVRRIGETADWRTLSFAIRNFIGAGVIRPDDKLEEWVRKEMDLPQGDEDTIREVVSPQNPSTPRVGPPRQGPPSANQGAGTGEDRSGGN